LLFTFTELFQCPTISDISSWSTHCCCCWNL